MSININHEVTVAPAPSGDLELQAAIIRKLESITARGNITFPIFDSVPQDQPAPYVTVGEAIVTDYSADVTTGFNMLFTVHTWTDYFGLVECKNIQAEIYGRLNRCVLNVAGYNCLGCDFESSDIMDDPNGITKHGVQQFRVLMVKI
jgi:hypothetical protein